MVATPVVLQCTLTALFYPAGAKGSLHVHTSRRLSSPLHDDDEVEVQVGKSVHATIHVSMPAARDTPVFVRWNVDRRTVDGAAMEGKPRAPFEQRYRCLAATGRADLASTVGGGCVIDMKDPLGVSVASVRVSADTPLVFSAAHSNCLREAAVSRLTRAVCASHERLEYRFGPAVPGLNTTMFTRTRLSVGQVPLWSHIRDTHSIIESMDARQAEWFFNRRLDIACHAMHTTREELAELPPGSPLPTEIVNEMMNLGLFTLYQRDGTWRGKDVGDDEWTMPFPLMRLMQYAYDCEDFTTLLFVCCHWFRNAAFTEESPLLRKLQAHDAPYVPMFALMVIFMDGAYSYHAALVKFRDSVLDAMGGRAPRAGVKGGKGHVMLLGESTASMPCEFPADMRRGVAPPVPLYEPIEANTKCPAAQILKKAVYRSLLLGITLDRAGVPTTRDFMTNGRIGVSMEALLMRVDSDPALAGVTTRMRPALRPGQLFLADAMYDGMPRHQPVVFAPTTTPPVQLYSETGVPRPPCLPRHEACYRYTDWTHELETAVLSHTGARRMEVYLISTLEGLRGYRVLIWA